MRKVWRLLVAAMFGGVVACSSSGGTTSGTTSGPPSGTTAGSPTGSTSSGATGSTGTPTGSTGSGTGQGTGSSNTTAGSAGSTGSGATSGSTSGGAIVFTIDMNAGPLRQFNPPAAPTPVSPLIYGIDHSALAEWEVKTKWGLVRYGGTEFTTYNWTNNYFNIGNGSYGFNPAWEADWDTNNLNGCFFEGLFSGGSATAAVLTANPRDSVEFYADAGIASVLTVPIVDYVSSNMDNAATCLNASASCTGVKQLTDVNTNNLVFATTNPASPSFVANSPTGDGGLNNNNPSQTGPVYQDQFVNYMHTTIYVDGGAPIFFALDSDPNRWGYVHPEVYPYDGGALGCGTNSPIGFDDITNRDIKYATAIKAAWPTTKVFGPEVVQDGILFANNQADPHLPTPFVQYYLGQMATASDSAGHPLLDVLDVHYYATGTNDADCVQTPRMFWDPNFTGFSMNMTDSIDFGYAPPGFETSWYPRQMIPRLEKLISTAYQGHTQAAPGLAFTEYNPGCDADIQGGLAEADMLGVFGREGVYAASLRPDPVPTFQVVTGGIVDPMLQSYQVAAFDSFRNYDGNGSTVGDLAISASSSNDTDYSVYAFTRSTDRTELDLVAVNRTSNTTTVGLAINNSPSFLGANQYQLVSGNPIQVQQQVGVSIAFTCKDNGCAAQVVLEPQSVTTFIIK